MEVLPPCLKNEKSTALKSTFCFFMQCATTTSEQTIPRLLFKKRRLYGARILDYIQGRKNRKKKQNKLENLTIFPAALSKRVTPVFEVKY